MVAMGNRLVVIRGDGLVFGADVHVVARNIQSVFHFSGAKIGFNPEDKFMVAYANELIVIRDDGLVFGALRSMKSTREGGLLQSPGRCRSGTRIY